MSGWLCKLRVARWVPQSSALLALVTFAVSAFADAPMLHEFIEVEASEDLELGATTPDGRMPAAARTPSGMIRAPAFSDPNSPRQVAYGGSATPDSIDSTFRLDRDTTEPSAVRYDDPFTPSVTPFKRQYAFDSVDDELSLGVHDKSLSAVPVGGVLAAGDDHFFGDLFVDVGERVPARIPSVGPGSRLLALRVEPPTELEVRRDSAENWYVVSAKRQRIRLILELAVPRGVFGSEFPDVAYSDLASWLKPLPGSARAAAQSVLSRLGLSRNVRPRDALVALVAHFRSFAASGELPRAPGGAALYLELALDKKGVCRHRAYGFVLTALALGLPARFVRNEAHAWVEVGDGRLWHRIDLGGAAQHFDADTRPGAPAHVPPADPFQWPEGAGSAESSVRGPGQAAPDGASTPRAAASAGASLASAAPRPAPPPPASSSVDRAAPGGELHPRSEIEFAVDGEARRGVPLHVSGVVSSHGEACPLARVDIVLVAPAGDTWIGSVPTNAAGRFDSHVTMPFDIDVGDYVLRASTPGAGSCGGSR